MKAYGQFCPVAKAAEVLCERWTVLVVRELLGGPARFRDLQRGVPGCPPATLSKRLRELASVGAVRRSGASYELTEAGMELYPLVEALGVWGQRWVRSRYGPDELQAEQLLWDLRRFLDPAGLGVAGAVVELHVTTPGEPVRRFWFVVDRGTVDLCLVPADRPVDLLVVADLRALTEVWMGDTTWAAAAERGGLEVIGPPALAQRLPGWMGRHPVLAGVAPARAR